MADKRFEVELPEEVLGGFGWQDADVPYKVREALVMDLLRLDRISEAQAAELLQLDRWALLDTIGRLDLLRRVVGELVIPDAVFQELTGQGHERPGAAEVTNAAWIRRHAVSDQAAVDRLPRVLHRGERQAIVLAREAHLEVPQTLFQLRQHVRTSLHVHGEPPVAAENTISQQILTKQY